MLKLNENILAAIDAIGFEPILAIFRKSGGWPVLDGNLWNEHGFDWKSSICKLREAGMPFNYLITFDIDANPKNTTEYVIFVRLSSVQKKKKKKQTNYFNDRSSAEQCYFFLCISQLGQPSLGIDHAYLSQGLGNEVVSAYYNEMVAFAVMLGADKTRAKKELEASLIFETKLAKVHTFL